LIVGTRERDRWLTEVHRNLCPLIQAVELVSADPLRAQDELLGAGEETLRWLGADPGPWPDITDVLRAVVHTCIGYGVMAAEVFRTVSGPSPAGPADAKRLYALGDRMLAEIEMLGEAGRRHGLA
jgi:hypothetical protein